MAVVVPLSNRKFSPVEQAILTTILYSDIFHFPLTYDELWQFLISKKKVSQKLFEIALANLLARKQVIYKDSYYCLTGRDDIIAERIHNLTQVEKKLALAKRIIPRLALIPTISFIGLSGGLAASCARKEDDIDLFVIVKKGTLYFSRFAVLFLLQLYGKRRKRGMQQAPDKFCVNFIIDETMLAWRPEERDLYIAREIAQLTPMFERRNMYTIFLDKNSWIEQFLPNVFTKKYEPVFSMLQSSKGYFFGIFEKPLRFIQISYIKSAHTTEIVTNHYVSFHPNDYRSKILKELRLKMQHLGLLTKL